MRQTRSKKAFATAKRDYERTVDEMTDATNLLVVSLESVLALGLVVNKATAANLRTRVDAVKLCLYGSES